MSLVETVQEFSNLFRWLTPAFIRICLIVVAKNELEFQIQTLSFFGLSGAVLFLFIGHYTLSALTALRIYICMFVQLVIIVVDKEDIVEGILNSKLT